MDETYDSDSGDGSIVIPSSSVIPESSPVHYANTIHLISTTPRFRMRLPNAEINLSPRGQRVRGQGVSSPRLSNWEHCCPPPKSTIHASSFLSMRIFDV